MDFKVKRWNSPRWIKKRISPIDLLICAADKPAIKISIECLIASKILNTPICFASVGYNTGAWGPFLKDDKKINTYLSKLNKMLNYFKKSKIENLKMSISYTNSIISLFLAMDISRFFIGNTIHSLNKKLQFDFERLEVSIKEQI